MIVLLSMEDNRSVEPAEFATLLRSNGWEYHFAQTPRQICMLSASCDVAVVLFVPADNTPKANDLLAELRANLGDRAPNVIALCRNLEEGRPEEGLYILPPHSRLLLETVGQARRDWQQRNRCRQLEREAQSCREQLKQTRLCGQLLSALLSSSPLQLGQSCTLAAAIVRQPTMGAAGFAPHELAHAIYGVKNILLHTELSPAVYTVENVLAPHHLLLLFYGSSDEVQPEQVSRVLQMIHDVVLRFLGLHLCFGVSGCHTQVSSSLYRQAYAALTPHASHTTRQLFFHSQLRPAPPISAADVQVLSHLVERRDSARLRKLAVHLLSCAKPVELLSAWVGMCDLVFSQLVRGRGDQTEHLANRLLFPTECQPELSDIGVLAGFIADAVAGGDKAQAGDGAKQNPAQSVKAYIDQNYSRELTVGMLADRFHLNYSYLSDLFHREIGRGINAYIMEARIEAAKKLLLNTDAGIHTVAELVGYRDIHYFHRVFKKYTGVTPMAYRQNTKNIQL